MTDAQLFYQIKRQRCFVLLPFSFQVHFCRSCMYCEVKEIRYNRLLWFSCNPYLLCGFWSTLKFHLHTGSIEDVGMMHFYSYNLRMWGQVDIWHIISRATDRAPCIQENTCWGLPKATRLAGPLWGLTQCAADQASSLVILWPSWDFFFLLNKKDFYEQEWCEGLISG